MKTTHNSLPTLLGCVGLVATFWVMPTHALAASCGRAQHASGPHALDALAHPGPGSEPVNGQGSIVGLWHTVYTMGGATFFESFDQWHEDGNEFEAADLQIGSMCQGTWVKAAPGTVRLFHVGWNFDSTGLTLVGYFTEIQIETLGADGMTYDGTFAIQNFDLSGNHLVGQDQKGTVHATRLTVP